jgi:hypothetical protein
VKSQLTGRKGPLPVYLELPLAEGVAVFKLPDALSIKPARELLTDLRRGLGPDAAVRYRVDPAKLRDSVKPRTNWADKKKRAG